MSEPLEITGFGQGGVVTEVHPSRLRPDQLCEAEDMVLPDGVVSERAGIAVLAPADPIAVTPDSPLDSVMSVRLVDDTATSVVVTCQTPTFGKLGGGGNVGFVNGRRVARAVYGGEVLLPHRDGSQPIIRWVGLRTGVTTGTGTYSIAEKNTAVIGSGTTFTSHVPVGSYLGGRWRVVSRTSNTEAAISAPADHGVTGRANDPNTTGIIGLRTLVTDKGTISHSSASTTVTGKGTKWLSEGDGFGSPQVGDFVLVKSDPTATPPVTSDIANIMVITAIGSDTSFTVAANSVGAITDAPYVILRPACGSEVCVHENAPWIAGVPWNDDIVYTAPPGYEMGQILNGRFGKTIQADEAMRLFEIPVPALGVPGKVHALLSTPWGLMVCRSEMTSVITGQYPSNDVNKLADYGVLERRAAVCVDDVAIIAGRDGIFAWRGGAFEEISAPRSSEWQTKATVMTRCVLGVVRGHLFVSFGFGINGTDKPECWVFDLTRKVCLGNWRSEDPANGIENAVWFDSARIPGERDKLLFVTNSTTMMVKEASTAFVDPYPDINFDYSAVDPGRLRIRTGNNLGGSLSRFRRVLGVKLTYKNTVQPQGGRVVLRASAGGEAFTNQVDLTNTGQDIVTRRYRSSGLNIGAERRSFQVEIARVTQPEWPTVWPGLRVKLYELELVVRRRHGRA